MPDSLDEALQAALALLAEGAADASSLWRTPTLATAGADGTPQLRTVVLRRFDGALLRAEIHTDRRSAKYAELRARPQAGLHGWDAIRRVQLRASGSVGLHVGDAAAGEAWASLHETSRATYRVEPGPGAVLAAPHHTAQRGEAAALADFCVIRLTITRLEWLLLEQGSYRRARFAWENGRRTAMWLVP